MKKYLIVALALMISLQTSVAFATGIAVQYEVSNDSLLGPDAQGLETEPPTFFPSPFNPQQDPKIEELTYTPEHGLAVHFTDARVHVRKIEGGIEGEISSNDSSESNSFTCKTETKEDLETCLKSSPVQKYFPTFGILMRLMQFIIN